MDDLILTTSVPKHRKRRSTFGDIPYANTNGLDDFFGFNATETKYLAEIKELNDMLSESTQIVDDKQSHIRDLQIKMKQFQQKFREYDKQLLNASETIENLQTKNEELLQITSIENRKRNNSVNKNFQPKSQQNELLESVTNLSLLRMNSDRSAVLSYRKRNSSKKLKKFNTFSAGTSPSAIIHPIFFKSDHKRNSSKCDNLSTSYIGKRSIMHSGSALLSKPKETPIACAEHTLILPIDVDLEGRHSMSASLSAFIEQVDVKFTDTPKRVSSTAVLERNMAQANLTQTQYNISENYLNSNFDGLMQSKSSMSSLESNERTIVEIENERIADMDFVAINTASFLPMRRSSLSDVEHEPKALCDKSAGVLDGDRGIMALQSNVNNFFVQEMNINTMDQSNNSVNNMIGITDVSDFKGKAESVSGIIEGIEYEEKYLNMIDSLNDEIIQLKNGLQMMIIGKNILAESTAVEMQRMRCRIQYLQKCLNK